MNIRSEDRGYCRDLDSGKWVRTYEDMRGLDVWAIYSDGYKQRLENLIETVNFNSKFLTMLPRNLLARWLEGKREDQIQAAEVAEKSAALYKSRMTKRLRKCA